jgi:hypothetical protein
VQSRPDVNGVTARRLTSTGSQPPLKKWSTYCGQTAFPRPPVSDCTSKRSDSPAATEDVIGHTDAHDLADLLDRAHGVRQLAYELDDNADRARELIRLERAAGMLRGVADNLRAAA